MKTTEEVKLIDDADEVDADEVDADGVVLLELVDQLALDIVWQLLRKRSLSANPSGLPRLHPDQWPPLTLCSTKSKEKEVRFKVKR